ncbi:MAG: CPBP family intramembrane metalloprotease [Proteobacteria bacterium]|nr:MAG: CPBP family intramembrane metalloprotease [Pseudomonadota bacterium]PIE19393.1 MAG: CPBP family intramembrane metalloprotease [Pseudomonadota bacterium]
MTSTKTDPPVDDAVGDGPVQEPVAIDRRTELVTTLVVFAAVTLACALLYQLRRVPLIARFMHDAIAAIFLIVPTLLVMRANEDFADHGLVAAPVPRGLLYFGGLSALVFPLFTAGFVIYYQTVCGWVSAGKALPAVYKRMCPAFVGSWTKMHPRIDKRFGWLAAAQLLVVALPEEYFFRGYLQTKLERVWTPKRRLLGGGLGVALIATSILFSLAHVLVDFNPLRFAVFFPSLVFGWLRSATGSILASVLFHACSNLISDVLHRSFF